MDSEGLGGLDLRLSLPGLGHEEHMQALLQATIRLTPKPFLQGLQQLHNWGTEGRATVVSR